MPATFDGPNLRIILPSPTAGVLNVNVAIDLYSDWKEWSQLSDNSKYYPAFRTAGGDPLTPGVEAGAYYFLRNDYGWRIISSDEDQTINYSGNLVAENSALPIIVATPGRTVLHLGLQPVTQRVDEILNQTQLAQYGGTIHIDTVSGVAGTSYPVGTPAAPVNNLADAYALSDALGFSEFHLRGSITLTRASTGEHWLGNGSSSSINVGGQNLNGSTFENASISGTYVGNGATVFKNCYLGTLTGACGVFEGCALTGTLTPDNDHPLWLFSCYSGIAGTGSPVLDGNNQATMDISIRDYSGGIRLSNFTVGDTVMTLGMNTGRVNVDASTTNIGTCQLRGIAYLNNESALTSGTGVGDQLNTAAFLDPSVLMSSVGLSADQDTKLTLLHKIMRNKMITDPVTGIMTIYDDDGATPLLTSQMYESTDTSQTYKGTGAQRRERLA